MIKRCLLILAVLLAVTACEDPRFTPAFRVWVLFPAEGLGDRSFSDDIYAAVEQARLETPFSVSYIIPGSVSDGGAWLHDLVRTEEAIGEPGLIIIAGNQYTRAVDELNGETGRHALLLLEGLAQPAEQVASVFFHTYAPSWLAGFLSASLVEQCRASLIQGFDGEFMEEYRAGFIQGVEDAGGTFHETYSLADDFSGFEKQDSAFHLTRSILMHTDLIFGLASGANLGIVNAARNYSEPRFVAGVWSDQSWMGLQVVTGSVFNRFDHDISQYISEFAKGRFESGSFHRSMHDQAAVFRINPLVLPESSLTDELIDQALQKETAWLAEKH